MRARRGATCVASMLTTLFETSHPGVSQWDRPYTSAAVP